MVLGQTIKQNENVMSNRINGVFQSSIAKFNKFETALTLVEERHPRGYVRGMFHGDDGLFWVVSGKDCKKLTEANYERIA